MVYLLSLVFLTANPVKVKIIFTSNIIGNFGKSKATWINPDFPPTLGGFESLKELVTKEREISQKKGELFLLLDSGNFTGGYITGDGFNPDSIAYYFNALGYDIANIGVRELTLFPVQKENPLDIKPSTLITLKDYLLKFKCNFISSNVEFPADSEYATLVSKYKIIDYRGIKIGIFGLVSENAPFFTYQYIEPQKDNIPFKIGREYETASKIVKELKEQGCDIIIMLSSIGYYRERFLARDVPGIDLILGGFDGFGERTAYVDPVNHTIILRNYDYLSQVGKIVLEIDPKAKTITSFNYNPITLFEEELTPLAPSEGGEGEE